MDFYNANEDLSLNLFRKFENDIDKRQVYRNIYNIINKNDDTLNRLFLKGMKIGIGYWGRKTSRIFTRHKFFITKHDEIIDVMRGYYEAPPTEYIIIKSVSLLEYLDVLSHSKLDYTLRNYLLELEYQLLNEMKMNKFKITSSKDL